MPGVGSRVSAALVAAAALLLLALAASAFSNLAFPAFVCRPSDLLPPPFLSKCKWKASGLHGAGVARSRLLPRASKASSEAVSSPAAAAAAAAAEEEEEEGGVVAREFAEELVESFGVYAISTIQARAIPDTRDGLKPVHRRILYAMQGLGFRQLGLSPSGPYRKSARVVGEVLGKLHPHGDKAVYDALVRLAQPFVSHLPLIEGHGNFGSIDGDPAAAMRYTECRLSPFCQDALLKDLHTSACSFRPNFDATEEEPDFLPARVPLLLLQGSSGVAVGLATSIPPHNLREVVAACSALIDNPRISDAALYRLLPAPDFPTGGVLVDPAAVAAAYKTGHGSLRLRARGHLQEKETAASSAAGRRHRSNPAAAAAAAAACGPIRKRQIIVTELPYGAELVRTAARLAADNLLPGVSEVRDESDFSGVRLAFELQPGASAREAWQHLLTRTPLQVYIHLNFVALTDGVEPQRLSLRNLLEAWLRARLKSVRARAMKEQQTLQQQQHISEGLLRAARQSEEVLAAISRCTDTQDAISKLTGEPFLFSEIQAAALLRMKVSSLLQLQQQQQQRQLEETGKRLAELQQLLSEDRQLYALIKTELNELADKYGAPRKTLLMQRQQQHQQQQQVSEAELALLLETEGETAGEEDEGKSYLLLATSGGLYKRVSEAYLSLQRRGLAGLRCHLSSSSSSSGNSRIAAAAACRDADWLLFIWRDGRCLGLRAAELQRHGLKTAPSLLPSSAVYRHRAAAAAAAAEAAGGGGGGGKEHLLGSVVRVRQRDTEGRLFVATKKGLVKAVSLQQLLPLSNVRRHRVRSLLSLSPADAVADCLLLQAVQTDEAKAAQTAQPAAAASAAVAAVAGQMSMLSESVVLATAKGRAIRFSAEAVKTLSPEAAGIKGISLKQGDSVVSAAAVPGGAEETGGRDTSGCLLLLTQQGQGKRLGLQQLKLQRRGGSGCQVLRLGGPFEGRPPSKRQRGGPQREGDTLAAVRWVGNSQQQQVALVTRCGAVSRQAACSAPLYSHKAAKGVLLQKLKKDDTEALAAVALLDEQRESTKTEETD
ncbi:hypothetical protein Efla_003490 [Eimeria flavescens]